VTAGLGVYAHRIETGEITAKPYTSDDVMPPPQAHGSQPKISQVNLDLMKKRIFMAEGIVHQESVREHPVLVILGEGNMVTAVSMPLSSFQQTNPISLSGYGFTGSIKGAILTSLDEQLLLVTSNYRFLLTTPRQLLDLQSMDMVIRDLHRMAEQETVCTLSSWTHIRQQEHLLLFTTRGFVRAFPMLIMRDSIEAPVPFKLDHPLPGLPVSTRGALNEDEFVLVTAHGRGLRWSINALRITGTQVANCGKEDRIAAAVLAQPNEELLILTKDGFGNRLLAGWIPFPEKPNRKGKSLIARRSIIAALAKTNELAVADKNLLAIRMDGLPLEDSTKSVQLFKLENGNHIRGALSIPME
jgi:DNA gyrase/topoisomerase IV subunit A